MKLLICLLWHRPSYFSVGHRIWRVKDFADGWIYFDSEAEARREAEETGALLQSHWRWKSWCDICHRHW